nr:reverse transcriptase domain-containing protein [Tanacetum cinerariifolium]
MKLNPKKCSFRVEERKFLGYMVTSEGMHANPKKTKAIADNAVSLDLEGDAKYEWEISCPKEILVPSS